MNKIINSLCDRPNYSIKQLTIQDAEILQTLCDRNRDFALLTYGEPFSATAARDEFNDLPPGKTPEDIHIFGLFDLEGSLAGAIVTVRNYPEENTWWIGLMMIAPEYRRQGLGRDFYRAFEAWLFTREVKEISLCVIEANSTGLRFWQQMGFEITRQTDPKAYGSKKHRLYVMSRTISKASAPKDKILFD